MGVGRLGPVLSRNPTRSGKTIDLRDGSNVPGVQCEVHEVPTEELARAVVSRMVHSPAGVDVCRPCVDRLMAWREAQRR